MIFSNVYVLEWLEKNIICVPGDPNIKIPQRGGAVQVGLTKPTARGTPGCGIGGQESLCSLGCIHPLQAANEGPVSTGDVVYAHWLSVKHCQMELLVITAGKLFSQYF